MITEADVDQYMRLYKRRFKKPIDRQDATEQLRHLVQLTEQVYKPITRQQYEDENEQRGLTSSQ